MMSRLLCVLALAVPVQMTHAATLFLRWEGVSGNTIDLAPRETARIEVWVELFEDSEDTENLTLLVYSNEPVPNVAQTDIEPNQSGWFAWGGGNGASLGDGVQQVAFYNSEVGTLLEGPGTFLVGDQTVRLISGDEGDLIEIAFSTEEVTAELELSWFYWSAAGEYFFCPDYSEFPDIPPGFFTYGAGSPGTDVQPPPCGSVARDPLIIHVTQSSPPDFDYDGDVDLEDFVVVQACWGPVTPGCEQADLDTNGFVDPGDHLAFVEAMMDPYTVSVPERCEICADADVDESGFVGPNDVFLVQGDWFWYPFEGDVDGSGVVDGGDLAIILSPACFGQPACP